MAIAHCDTPPSFDELVEALAGLAKVRLSFALVRVELAQRLGHEPVLRDVWAEFTHREPDAVRGVRVIVARGLVTCPNGEKPAATADPLVETSVEWLQLVPRWWHLLESIRLSLAG